MPAIAQITIFYDNISPTAFFPFRASNGAETSVRYLALPNLKITDITNVHPELVHVMYIEILKHQMINGIASSLNSVSKRRSVVTGNLDIFYSHIVFSGEINRG